MAPKWFIYTTGRTELFFKIDKTKGRGRPMKEKIMSSVANMLSLGCLLDFQVEM